VTLTLQAPHHCELCEHSGDLCAQLVRDIRSRTAVTIEQAMREHVTLAPLEITVECPCYWRRGRVHGV
jgi:hypothetical protein